MMPHHWRTLAHERNSAFNPKHHSCTINHPKRTGIHNDQSPNCQICSFINIHGQIQSIGVTLWLSEINLVNKNKSVLSDCDKSYQTNKKSTKRVWYWSFVQLCIMYDTQVTEIFYNHIWFQSIRVSKRIKAFFVKYFNPLM